MKTPPNTLLHDFAGKTELEDAIVRNHPTLYIHLAKGIMDTEVYTDFKREEGRIAAYRMLTETLIVFRRQIKHSKAEITIQGSLISVNKHHELKSYLIELFLLMIRVGGISKYLEIHKKPDFDFRVVYQLKDKVVNTLFSLRLSSEFNADEVFQDTVITLWEKIHQNEIGLFQKADSFHLDNWYAFNRKFFHYSKLSTFLTGIARNIILQGDRYKKTRKSESIGELEHSLSDPETIAAPDPILKMYTYFRVFVEERKLRSVVSILHYDCGLEEKEVCTILGLKNARMHNARLKNNFNTWCASQSSGIPDFFEAGEGYLSECYQKEAMLNAKYRILNSSDYHLPVGSVELSAFSEEFRSTHEFLDSYLILKNILYLLSKGKPSNLAGLPNEEPLRKSLSILKSGILTLEMRDAILYLFFYSSCEPPSVIKMLMNTLKAELSESDKSFLPDRFPEVTQVKNDLYTINHLLFKLLNQNRFFTQMN